MAPTKLINLIPERSAEDIAKLSNDASILKQLMGEHNRRIQSLREPSPPRVEYYPRQRKEFHESTVSLECDSHTGCHARTGSAQDDGQASITTTFNGQQVSFAEDDDDEADSYDGDGDGDGNDDDDDDVEDDLSLSYEQLKELYRNCHSSPENRYSYLLNCSPYNHPQEKEQHATIGRITPATTNSHSIYFNSLQTLPTRTDGLVNMFLRAPGTFTFILVSLLVIAIVLVEMLDIFCYRRRRRARDEEQNFKMRRRRLRTRGIRIPTVTVYDSPAVYGGEKTS
ncbi:hypothetical protein TSTA_087320 [Talaromyces stipitatus ATCC 10500]|uniref:Uncharacterized protein n=1 Tax=Talaromyces stipitatus (strain ATCC 10500 / CBS 375.48 / QM 6759 / NRRL 1006) TaxID=441959 RepID=B8M232_TALSN|nr:uncharacterized protein TSTA_087320 [Talaromyces stipitatus ATCC 10500]EED21496.1 hypothetical protein TSTA_087320 [Talaromyces stipitatus ATCC 10500]